MLSQIHWKLSSFIISASNLVSFLYVVESNRWSSQARLMYRSISIIDGPRFLSVLTIINFLSRQTCFSITISSLARLDLKALLWLFWKAVLQSFSNLSIDHSIQSGAGARELDFLRTYSFGLKVSLLFEKSAYSFRMALLKRSKSIHFCVCRCCCCGCLFWLKFIQNPSPRPNVFSKLLGSVVEGEHRFQIFKLLIGFLCRENILWETFSRIVLLISAVNPNVELQISRVCCRTVERCRGNGGSVLAELSCNRLIYRCRTRLLVRRLVPIRLVVRDFCSLTCFLIMDGQTSSCVCWKR